MAAGDFIGVRKNVLKHTYSTTGIKSDLVRIATRRVRLFEMFMEDWLHFHCSGQSISSFSHIEGITLGISEKI